jgi:hypothetical protein
MTYQKSQSEGADRHFTDHIDAICVMISVFFDAGSMARHRGTTANWQAQALLFR